MRLTIPTLMVLLASCGKPAPSHTVTPLAPGQSALRWVAEACGQALRESVTLYDYSLPAGMDTIEVMSCGLPLLRAIDNARVELQSGEGGVCAIRIGPSNASAVVDATSIESLFADKPLGARVRALVEPGAGSTYARVGMVDNVRVAVRQWNAVRGSMFYLVVDGCGHGPDLKPGMSAFL